MMRGTYIADIDFKSIPSPFPVLEERGLTDVIYYDQNLLPNYPQCKQNVNDCLTSLETTNIKMHYCTAPFKNTTWNNVDPANSDFKTLMSSKIGQLLSDCSIHGISFDDYFIDSSLYNAQNKTQQIQDLVNYTEMMATTTHNAGGLFSVAPLSADARSTDNSQIAIYCDFIIPQIYRLNGGMLPVGLTEDQSHSWVKNKIKTFKNDVGNNIKTIPALITYVSDSEKSTYYPQNSINEDIRANQQINSEGYILFALRHSSPDILFPSFVPVPRKTVNRKTI